VAELWLQPSSVSVKFLIQRNGRTFINLQSYSAMHSIRYDTAACNYTAEKVQCFLPKILRLGCCSDGLKYLISSYIKFAQQYLSLNKQELKGTDVKFGQVYCINMKSRKKVRSYGDVRPNFFVSQPSLIRKRLTHVASSPSLQLLPPRPLL
jgi:hypothetical protein